MMPCLMALHRKQYRNNPKARTEWAVQQLKCAAKASQNLGLNAHATFSGALLWHTVYPWPQRPAGLVETGFTELANRWLPILNVFDENGVDVCYEIHPGEDLHDGETYEMFLTASKQSSTCLFVVRSVPFCIAMPRLSYLYRLLS